MVSDLKSDTADLKSYLAYTGFAVKNIDTLMQLLSKNDPKDIPQANFIGMVYLVVFQANLYSMIPPFIKWKAQASFVILPMQISIRK